MVDFYEVRTPNPAFTSTDRMSSRYGVKFLDGVAHVRGDMVWRVSGPDGPTDYRDTPVVKMLEHELGYEVRKLEPGEVPLDRVAPTTTTPARQRDTA